MPPTYAADVSDYQSGFDIGAYPWPHIILKASEGATWRSGTMAAWRDEAHARGLIVGLYHYLRANATEAEVANFLSTTGGLRDDEYAVCDYEMTGGPGLAEMGPDADIPEKGTPMGSWWHRGDHLLLARSSPAMAYTLAQDYAAAWLDYVQAETGRVPVLYSYTSYLAARSTDRLLRWPLWVANYARNDGAEHPWPGTDAWAPLQDGPGVYPHERRTIGWQFSSEGTIPESYGGRLDVNRFELDVAGLRRLCGGQAAPPPDPDPLQLHGRTLLVRA